MSLCTAFDHVQESANPERGLRCARETGMILAVVGFAYGLRV